MIKMKRVCNFVIVALFAASSVFVGCSSDPSDAPSITVRFDGNASSTGVFAPNDLYVGDPVDVEVEFNVPGKIKEIRIAKASGTGENPPGTYPKTKDFLGETIDKVKWTVVGAAVGTVKYSADVTDKDKEAQSATKIIEITFKERPPLYGETNAWANLLLGSLSHSGTAGASCASIDGKVYEIAEAKTNSAKIDFVYWNGASNPNSIAAPSNTTLGTITAMQSGWTTKNQTKLQRLTTVTVAAFNAMNNDAEIVEKVTATTVTGDIVSNLKVDDIIGFITVGGKKGLMKVNSVGTPANHIDITIKVQK